LACARPEVKGQRFWSQAYTRNLGKWTLRLPSETRIEKKGDSRLPAILTVEEAKGLLNAAAQGQNRLCRGFDKAEILRFKSNLTAKRGGGPVYYSVPGVEKFLRQRILNGRGSSLAFLRR
jgi:hypothetical protein